MVVSKTMRIYAILLVLLFSVNLRGKAAILEDFEYEAEENGVVITKYIGNQQDVTIPSIIEGQPVTRIGWAAFARYDSLERIVIPGSVESIGANAFSSCVNLKDVVLSNGLLSIELNAFGSCTKLSGVIFPNSLKIIGSSGFYNCDHLVEVKIPKSVTSIELGDAFSSCEKLTAIEVDPENTNFSSVDGVLFNKDQTVIIQCPGAKTGDYIIPQSVIEINRNAFHGCDNLKSVLIGRNIQTLPLYIYSYASPAFGECESLEAILVDPDNPHFCSVDGVLFDKEKTTILQYPSNKPGEYIIPDHVTAVRQGAFYRSLSLTRVTIGKNVSSIREVFYITPALKEINVDSENSTFVSIDGVVYSRDQTVLIRFPGGRGGEFVIPSTVTEVGCCSFKFCSSLRNVILSEGVRYIGPHAFRGCENLTSMVVPASVNEIGDSAFSYCYKLSRFYFKGDPPTVEYGFETRSIDPIIVRYRPGANGWGDLFYGHPTEMWTLQILDYTFEDNAFHIKVTSPNEMDVVIMACINLVEEEWVALGSMSMSNGINDFVDPIGVDFPNRYYIAIQASE